MRNIHQESCVKLSVSADHTVFSFLYKFTNDLSVHQKFLCLFSYVGNNTSFSRRTFVMHWSLVRSSSNPLMAECSLATLRGQHQGRWTWSNSKLSLRNMSIMDPKRLVFLFSFLHWDNLELLGCNPSLHFLCLQELRPQDSPSMPIQSSKRMDKCCIYSFWFLWKGSQGGNFS